MTEYISSRRNPTVMEVLNAAADPTSDFFILQGDKFIRDAAKAHPASFRMLFTDNIKKYPDLIELLPETCRIFEVTPPVMDKLSMSVSTSSLLAVIHKPETVRPDKLILLDGVQDPGNVGTVIRTAYSFGFGVICGENCANPFSPKSVRATAGAVLGCHVLRLPLEAYVRELIKEDYTIYGSALDEKAVALPEVGKQNGRLAVIIGSEGKGVKESLLELADRTLYIPIKNVESLNAAVAAAIFAYTFSL